MKTIVDYLDEAKEKTGSDYKTAQVLDVTRQYVSKMRAGKGVSNEAAVKLAGILSIDPMEIIAAAEANKHPEKADFWGKWVAAAVILSVAAFSEMPEKPVFFDSAEVTSLYIMRGLFVLSNVIEFLFTAAVLAYIAFSLTRYRAMKC